MSERPTLDTWLQPGHTFWSFRHTRELVPTERIRRGSTVRPLVPAPRPELLDVEVDTHFGRIPVREVLGHEPVQGHRPLLLDALELDRHGARLACRLGDDTSCRHLGRCLHFPWASGLGGCHRLVSFLRRWLDLGHLSRRAFIPTL